MIEKLKAWGLSFLLASFAAFMFPVVTDLVHKAWVYANDFSPYIGGHINEGSVIVGIWWIIVTILGYFVAKWNPDSALTKAFQRSINLIGARYGMPNFEPIPEDGEFGPVTARADDALTEHLVRRAVKVEDRKDSGGNDGSKAVPD